MVRRAGKVALRSCLGQCGAGGLDQERTHSSGAVCEPRTRAARREARGVGRHAAKELSTPHKPCRVEGDGDVPSKARAAESVRAREGEALGHGHVVQAHGALELNVLVVLRVRLRHKQEKEQQPTQTNIQQWMMRGNGSPRPTTPPNARILYLKMMRKTIEDDEKDTVPHALQCRNGIEFDCYENTYNFPGGELIHGPSRRCLPWPRWPPWPPWPLRPGAQPPAARPTNAASAPHAPPGGRPPRARRPRWPATSCTAAAVQSDASYTATRCKAAS